MHYLSNPHSMKMPPVPDAPHAPVSVEVNVHCDPSLALLLAYLLFQPEHGRVKRPRRSLPLAVKVHSRQTGDIETVGSGALFIWACTEVVDRRQAVLKTVVGCGEQ